VQLGKNAGSKSQEKNKFGNAAGTKGTNNVILIVFRTKKEGQEGVQEGGWLGGKKQEQRVSGKI